MTDRAHHKKVEQANYRASLAEAELRAVTQSKAYKLARTAGLIKKQLASDPVGLGKKVARTLIREPAKLKHAFRTVNRGAFMTQSTAQLNAKYQEWILLNEPDEMELNNQRQASENLAYQPVISILTPVFNPPVDVLEELIESVLEQTYPNFELCLGDFGDDQAVRDLLQKYADLDPRIKYYQFAENKGIAGNSNQILEKVTGEFVALLDHDDTLSPDALFENVRMLNEQPYDFLYSDKDKIDEAGNRFEPLFKPQLSPEMLLNINYLTHLNVMRTSIMRDIGGWDSETDGAQDWDIFLRVIAASKQVGHIPKVLYHWRVIASSTAMSIETKPYALAGQRKAVDKFMALQGIPATSYHRSTELFLKWNEHKIDRAPVVLVRYSNQTNTTRIMRHIKKTAPAATFMILASDRLAGASKQQLASMNGVEVVEHDERDFYQKVDTAIKKLSKGRAEGTVLFIRDDIRLPKNKDWYEDLTGWLAIKDVAAVSGRLVDRHDLIVESAGVIKQDGSYFPLFKGLPRFYQSYVGNAEWIRNVSMITDQFSATKLSHIKEFGLGEKTMPARAFSDYFLWLTKKHRLVMTPHATASIFEEVTDDGEIRMPLSKSQLPYLDIYSNPNMNPNDPLRLFEDEVMIGQESGEQTSVDAYQHDATILASTFDITQAEIDASVGANVAQKGPQTLTSVAWILPSYDAVYAGLMNIFSFANYLCDDKGVKTTFYILKAESDAKTEKVAAEQAFKGLSKARFVAIRPDEVDKIAAHDIGIATQWATAYPLAKAKSIGRKHYFIQDNEVNFYPKGSISSLVELSYRFGFRAIANTDGLLDMYRQQYGGDGIVLKSRVDLTAYFPREDRYYTPSAPYKVFFYARPNMPRNAFELGIAGLKKLKQNLGNDVEIITAGAAWNPDDYGVAGLFTNLGKLQYAAVPKLYRSVDAGLMFMFSGHPGVTASELMASGCPVVVNEYDDITWNELYQHEKTCLITKATASEIAHNLQRCLVENDLRKRLIDGGITKAGQFYSGYEASLEDAYRSLLNG